MEALTPEQNKQLLSWASQRDSILIDIGNKKTENEKLSETNKNLASSNTEIADKIQQSIGRLAELDKKEEERVKLLSIDIANLETKKSVLQTEVASFESEIIVLTESKSNLHLDIENAMKFHESVFSRASDIERIVTETVTLNSNNSREIKNILIEAGIELKKIIDIGAENVEVTNRTISAIPKIIVDLHRDVLERKKISRHKII